MLAQLRTYLKYGSFFCGIEHTVQLGQHVIHTTTLKKSKNSLDIENTYSNKSIKNIIPKLAKNQHAFLVINDDNVLSKSIDCKQIESDKMVFMAFPNINLEDFFYEIIPQNDKYFIAICRKSYVNKLISEYANDGVYIINISLGNSVVTSISHFMEDASITTSNAMVSFENNSIVSIQQKETQDNISSYTINGLEANSNNIISMCAALDVVLRNFKPKTNFENLKKNILSHFNQSRFYTQFIKSSLVFILSILAINFFIFNHYFNKVNNLRESSQINNVAKQKIIELNQSVDKSQKMVADMLNSNSSKSSYYINFIIQGLPASILLSEINYQPILKSIKTGHPIEEDKHIIMISGESNDSNQFSKWITILETVNWLKKAEILKYEDTSRTNSNFSLKLTIADEL